MSVYRTIGPLVFRPMASTNLSNTCSTFGTITMSHNDSLGLKLVFYGIIDFLFLLLIHFNKNS